MRLPHLNMTATKTQKQIIAFGGLNYGLLTSEGELSQCYGLSSVRFPCLSQRGERKTVATYNRPTALYARGALCVVDGTDFLYGGEVVGQVVEGEKQIATINTKIVIFPDKVYYDTSTKEFAKLDAIYAGFPDGVTFTADTLSVAEQSYIDQANQDIQTVHNIPFDTTITVYDSVRVDSETGALAFTGGTAKTPGVLVDGDIIQYECGDTQYMVVEASVFQSGDTYDVTYILHESVLHEYTAFEGVFKAGDAVEITGCTSFPTNNGTHIVRAVSDRTLTFSSDIFTEVGVEAGTILLQRKVPDLVCICESDNRIWGAEGATIYASALGDPTNFFVYDGLSTDSYAVAVGTDGDFTGCVSYASAVLFFKEDCVHKVLGNYPAQYEVYTYIVPGIQIGSEKSLAIINETLFYKGRNGVYAYTGGAPELLSGNFGTRRYTNAVAGTDGERYYISMMDEKGVFSLYVLDVERGIWLMEDDTQALDFANTGGALYYLDADTNTLIMMGHQGAGEEQVAWSATLCQMDEVTQGKKGYSKLYIRADIDAGAWLKIEISTDGAPFRQVFITHNEHAKTVQVPILPMRCDNFRIRLSGKGGCIIKSVVREFAVGSAY